MFFYPKFISSDAVEALNNLGLNTKYQEIEIPNDLIASSDEMNIILVNGVHLCRRQITFSGHRDAPKVWSSLEGDMVPTRRDQNQCEVCGHWFTDRETPSDEWQHDRNCHPQYEWDTVGMVQA